MKRLLTIFIFVCSLSAIYAAGLPHLVTGTVVNSDTITHPGSIQVKISYQGSDYYWQWSAQVNTLKGSLYNAGSGEFCLQVSDVNGYNTGNIAQLTIKGNDGSETTTNLTKSSTSRTTIGTINLAMNNEPIERAALAALYNSCGGANWTNNTNWLSAGPLSTWWGVTITNNRVTQIALNGNNLIGTLPAELGQLTNLQHLYLSYNSLTGIATETLPNLQTLDLFHNNLTGSIPVQIGNFTSLRYLYLDNNQLSGTIPISLGNLVNLQHLFVSGNQLSGSIPEVIGSLSNLQALALYSNQLTGSIPVTIGNLTNLNSLDLRFNQLGGAVPTQINNLTNLSNFNISGNNFENFPTITGPPNTCNFNVSNNLFQFDDFSSAVAGYGTWTCFPQKNCHLEDYVTIFSGLPYTMTSTIGGTNLTYSWYQDGNLVSTNTTGSYTINNAQSTHIGTYTCTVYSSQFNAYIYRNPIHFNVVTVNHSPIIDLPTAITINQNEITTVDFSPYISDPDGDHLTLSVMGSNHINVAIDSLSATFTPQNDWVGNENLTFTVNDGVIQSTRDTASDMVIMQVRNPLLVDFSTNSNLNNNVVAADPLTTLTFSATANLLLTSYQWDFNNDGTTDSTSPTPSWIYAEPGLMSVTLTASDGIHVTTLTKTDYIQVFPGIVVPPMVIDENVVWTEAGGPYNITGEIMFNPGANLTIMPDAQVNMLVDSLIVINGNINATDANITAYGENGWGGLVLNSSASNSVISGLTLLGAATGITINGCNPNLSDLNLSGASSTRTQTTAIVITGDANPIISNIQMNNFDNGIRATNTTATNVTLNMNHILIHRDGSQPSELDIGIELTGNYSMDLDQSFISGYPTGIKATGFNAARRQARLTNVRIIRTQSSTRDNGKAIWISNFNDVFIQNDSLSGFSTGIEFTNSLTSQASLHISSSQIYKSPLQIETEYAVQLSGLMAGIIDSLLVQNYRYGIDVAGNQQLQIAGNRFVNCSTVMRSNQNHQSHSLQKNIAYRNGMFNGTTTAPAFELTATTNLNISNNTVFSYPNILNAANSSHSDFSQNIAWSSNPTGDPITLDGSSTINATYNNIALQTGIYPGIGNLTANPLFENPSTANFALNVYSPCIDAGNPANPIDPDGSIADMGAIPFDQTTMPLIADFYCDVVSGQNPLTVQFSDHSTFNAITWSWDLNGDNVIESNVQNPTWIYTTPGIYTVKLTVTSTDSIKTKELANYITVHNAAPTIIQLLPDLTRAEDFTSFQIDLSNYFADPNGDPLSFSFAKDSAIVDAVINQNILTITCVPELHGTVNFTVTADDGLTRLLKQRVSSLSKSSARAKEARISVSDIFVFTVNPINDPPVISSCSPEDSLLNITTGTTEEFSVTATDVDSQISYSWYVDDILQDVFTSAFSYQFTSANTYIVRVVLNDNAGSIIQMDWHVQVSVGNNDVVEVPLLTRLFQNQPNPFSDLTNIRYSMKDPGFVKLSVFNTRGQLVKVLRAANEKTGTYSVSWNGKNESGRSVTNGVYILKLETKDYTCSKKLLRCRN